MEKVIVISAHPDDEILGAGGTLLKHKANGDVLAWLIVTNISEEMGFGSDKVNLRQIEIENVANPIIRNLYNGAGGGMGDEDEFDEEEL